ncbi:MAG: HNH endonuclease [Gammaproteobacteria bacterium]|nr:HNH endonuclease [Gammaproteobacteria bacterium]MCY4297127.1 HNH endonuclease [Gammaproteobacteria bacterium]
MHVVRCLSSKGLDEFAGYLDQLRHNGELQPPIEILTDPLYSDSCDLGKVLVAPRNFTSRREFAGYINQRFLEAGVLTDADEPGMWEWLSLFYFDAVCPISRDGKRKPGVDGRHLLNDATARRRHRHLLRGPYMRLRHYDGGPDGELDILLSDALPKHGIAATHLGERRRLMSSRGALIAASRLYADPVSGKPRRGYSDEENGLRSFCKFLNNLPDCFDLSGFSSDMIIALLPESFSMWLNSTEHSPEPSLQAFEKLKHIGALRDGRSVARQLDSLLGEIDARKMTKRQIAVRSGMFRTAVLGAYESRCAISGIGLRHADGNEAGAHFEVEAAHIVPVHRGGRDLVRNGLALNRTIHWAFDHGMLWIDGDLRICLAKEVSTDTRNHWLLQFQHQQLQIPPQRQHHPDREALRWHTLNVARAN